MSIALPHEEQTTTRPRRAHSKPVSEARLKANRLNAQKSTGPRTKQGKARWSQNAHRHNEPTRNPFLRFNRYETSLRNTLLRLLRTSPRLPTPITRLRNEAKALPRIPRT